MNRCSAGFLPTEITAGLPFTATVKLAAYPADTWGAKLHLRGPKAIDIDATGNGTTYTFSVTDTAAWAAGDYWYSLRVGSGDDVREIERGEVRVLPDMVAAGDGFDGRSANEIALAAINAVLAKRATQDQQRYVIDKRELWRTPIADLIKLQAFYASKVRREKARKSGRGGLGRQIPVRFSA